MTIRRHRDFLATRLGHAIHRLRRAKGWTRTKLAQRSGISVTYVRQLEEGANVPTITIFVELAEVLGVSAADLMQEVTEGVPSS